MKDELKKKKKGQIMKKKKRKTESMVERRERGKDGRNKNTGKNKIK